MPLWKRSTARAAADRRQGMGTATSRARLGRWPSLIRTQATRDQSWPPQGGPFSGATIAWSYPERLHGRALTRVAVVRHAISVLLDDLEGSTTVEVQ
jgi:hypothetical protein